MNLFAYLTTLKIVTILLVVGYNYALDSAIQKTVSPIDPQFDYLLFVPINLGESVTYKIPEPILRYYSKGRVKFHAYLNCKEHLPSWITFFVL